MAESHRIGVLNARWNPSAQRVGEARDASRAWPDRLRDALGPVLDRLATDCGYPPDALIMVGRIELRLDQRPGEDLGALASRAAEAIGKALRERLQGAIPGRPFFDADVAVFPDAFAAETWELSRHLSGMQPEWFAPQALQGFGGKLRPAEMMAHWLRHEPRRAVAFLARAAATDPARFDALLSEAQACSLMAALRSAFGQGPLSQDVPQAEDPYSGLPIIPQSASSLAPRGPEAPITSPHRAFRQALAWADRDPAGWMAAGRPIVIDREPVSRETEGKNTSFPIRDQAAADLASHADRNASFPPTTPTETALEPLETRSNMRSDSRLETAGKSRPERDAGIVSGGLLLLLAPIFRLPVARRLPELPAGLALAERQIALGRRLFAEAYAGYPETWRRGAWSADRPLLAAFAGIPLDNPALDIHPLPAVGGAEASDAVRNHLDAMIRILGATLPADLGPAAIPRVPGARPNPLGASPSWADLLHRPGTLIVTHTHAELHWPMAFSDLGLRRAGWDLDPGWIPALGRIFAFRYGENK